MNNYPLISAVVIHYNNGEFIFETISSILMQDYPNIELLISDDCSSNGFDVNRIIDFINEHRKDNIKRVIINENKKNLGTVKNLEVIREKEQGEYELLIAGDDVWHDEHVFSAFAERFDELGPDAEWIVSQMEMRDETLKTIQEQFVKPEIIELIQRKAYDELLVQEVKTVCFPSAGTGLRRTFFEKVNHLGDDYDLIEDYPMQLRALRMGIPVYYLDIVSVMHRHGGVSHGNQRNSSAVYARYINDFMKIFENEIFRYEDRFPVEAIAITKKRYKWYKQQKNKMQLDTGYTQESAPASGKNKNFIKQAIIYAKEKVKLLATHEKLKNDALLLLVFLFCGTLLQMGKDIVAQQFLLTGAKAICLLLILIICLRIGIYVLIVLFKIFRKWKG